MTDKDTHTPLPCPFCGSKALIGQTFDNAWYAMCEVDHCSKIESYWRTESEALAAWNTRADSHHRLVEALRGLAGNAGALRAFEWEIREACGNTNWQCLMDAIAKADAALKEAGRG